jgi:hypothetical protein
MGILVRFGILFCKIPLESIRLSACDNKGTIVFRGFSSPEVGPIK